MLEIVKEPKHWAANDPINRHLGVLARRDGWDKECDRARAFGSFPWAKDQDVLHPRGP